MSSADQQHPERQVPRLIRWRLRLAEVFQPTEIQITLFWAGIIGFLGACASVAFRRLTDFLLELVTQRDIHALGVVTPSGGFVEIFTHLPPWQRLVIPMVGGVLAGLTLFFGMRWRRQQSSTDYMEAIVLGDGVLSARSSLVKSLSAMFSISSGASIGREGPLVQLSAMLASLLGRWRRTPTLRLRLLVACGAAAGIASAYNAPIAGAMFVAEIVLQSMAMETFGPLVFASVIATVTIRRFLGEDPLYVIPVVRLGSNWEILPLVGLGLLAGLMAPWFLRLLRGSERLFASSRLPAYVRLGLGGLVVGAIAVWHAEVCGNGYSIVTDILRGDMFWKTLLLVAVLKVVATAVTFGSGAVGGVFTPTLFTGAALGYLFWQGLHALWPSAPLLLQPFAVVGMGALLAATTHAPIMAIIMLFELTRDYEMILPLMLACVVAHYACLTFERKSIYADSLQRKGAGTFRQYAAHLKVAQIMKPDPIHVQESSEFRVVAESFVANRFNYLYVTDPDGRFRGVISLHDIKSYLTAGELAELVIARDIMQEHFPTITPDASLTEALERFAHHDGERLPVTSGGPDGSLLGSISKTDVILALAERAKPGPGATVSDSAFAGQA